jgi:hypothetical protein
MSFGLRQVARELVESGDDDEDEGVRESLRPGGVSAPVEVATGEGNEILRELIGFSGVFVVVGEEGGGVFVLRVSRLLLWKSRGISTSNGVSKSASSFTFQP